MSAPPRKDADAPLSTRERLVEIAGQIFLSSGYDTKVESVAAAAGVTRQTIYNLFGSKDDLFKAVIDRFIEAAVPHLLTFEIPGDLRGSLMALAEAYVEVLMAPQTIELNRLILSQAPRFPERASAIQERSATVVHTHLQAYLQERMRAGDLIEADYGIAAEQFLGALLGQDHARAMNLMPTDSGQRRKRKCEMAVATFIRGYGTPPQAS